METIRFIIPKEEKNIRQDLPFSGTDAQGNSYTADGRSLKKNGRRFLPVMGEFHFTRFEPEFWREEILKMKAGGVDIVATYLFWIHHEERQGAWDFSGRRDVRRFVELCGECGLGVWLRIGPWAHGECRNGGFPDWLQKDSSIRTRENDPKYLALVKMWFERIFREVQGLFVKDGGPVLGVQLENEYGHCGGPLDRGKQRAHMKKLYEMARETGFIVPFYTATAWGGACTIDETLQVLSGYVDAPWDDSTGKLPPKDNFRFIPYFDDADTGSDYTKDSPEKSKDGAAIRTDYPYLTAELGGGLQVTSHRRPIASAKDNEAAILCALGSGANLIGYYMYHGGINPDGRDTTLNESQESGGHTNTPVKSYDFDACLNEAGKPQESYGGLKKYALFLHCFGEDLAGTDLILPEEKPESATDLRAIRAALRLNRESGNAYLFVNNHQRNYELSAHPDVRVAIGLPEGRKLQFGPVDFEAGSCCLYRFNVHDQDEKLIPANPLCFLGNRRIYWLDGMDESSPEAAAAFDMSKSGLSPDPGITVLSECEANRAFLYEDGLFITQYDDSILIEDRGRKKLITTHAEETLTLYRADGSVERCPIKASENGTGGNPGEGSESPEKAGNQAETRLISEERNPDGGILYRDYLVRPDVTGMEDAHRLFLCVDYLGDRAEVYEAAPRGRLLDDWFTTGKRWMIFLNRFGCPGELMIRIYDSDNTLPCSFSREVYYDLPVKRGCEILGAVVQAEYLADVLI